MTPAASLWSLFWTAARMKNHPVESCPPPPRGQRHRESGLKHTYSAVSVCVCVVPHTMRLSLGLQTAVNTRFG